MKTISIISPVYNEGEGLEIYFEAMKKAIESEPFKPYQVEVLLADNASTDDSALYLEQIARRDKRFKVIFNARNVGVFSSCFNALSFAKGDAVFLMVPSDLQDPLEIMGEMIRKWEEGHLVVAGRRARRQESFLTRFLRGQFYSLLAHIADQPMEPGVGEYQLVDRRVVRELLSIPDAAPFPRGMLAELGYRPCIIDYEWRARAWGRSSFSMAKLFRTAYDMTFTFSRLPLRLIMIMGFIIAGFSLAFGLFQIIAYFVQGPVAGRGVATIITAIFFFAGVNSVFLGIIGEYVGRIYQQTRFGRRVAVRRLINFDDAATERRSAE